MADSPYNVDAEISSLCSTGLRPELLTGVVLRILTHHFSREKGISHPQLKSYIWSNNIKDTKINIVPLWRWDTRKAQNRPAIVVKRNALRPKQIALADGASLVHDFNPNKVPSNQPATQQVAMIGSHTIFALSTIPYQAEIIGSEISSRLIQYAQVFQSEFGFHRFRVAEIGALNKVEEASEYFSIPITVAYTYVDAWQVWSTSPYLKRLVFGTEL